MEIQNDLTSYYFANVGYISKAFGNSDIYNEVNKIKTKKRNE